MTMTWDQFDQIDLLRKIPRGKTGEPKTPRLAELLRQLTLFSYGPRELRLIAMEIDLIMRELARGARRR